MSRRRVSGFTLVEVLVGTGILFLGLTGMLGLLQWIHRGNAFDSYIIAGAALAHGFLQHLSAQGFDAISQGGGTQDGYTVNWTVTSVAINTKSIGMTVS